jgi:hypothetical protein
VAEEQAVVSVVELPNLALQRRTGIVVRLFHILNPGSDDSVESIFPRVASHLLRPATTALPGLSGNFDKDATEQRR